MKREEKNWKYFSQKIFPFWRKRIKDWSFLGFELLIISRIHAMATNLTETESHLVSVKLIFFRKKVSIIIYQIVQGNNWFANPFFFQISPLLTSQLLGFLQRSGSKQAKGINQRDEA